MTRVSFDKQGLDLRISGHAGAGEYGKDLVCAAESVLLYTLLDWVQRREALMHPQVFMSPGAARIVCRPEGRSRRRCAELMEAIFRGYELLSESYPQCVRVENGQASKLDKTVK